MKKFIPPLILTVVTVLFGSFSDASTILDELRAGPERAWTCGQTISDSRTFSDEPSRLLWNITAGGSVGSDDVTFFYKDGSPIEAAGGPDCAGFTSPSDIICSKACSGTENITWKTYFQDSGAGSPDSVTMSGTAYETYQPTELVTDVAFNGWQIRVFWNDCGTGQRVDNGQCIPVTGSITSDKTSCTAPCNVNLNWNTNSYQTAAITKNGNTLTTVTTTSGVSNTYTSGGPVSDSGLAAGTYNYCIKGNYARSPDNQPVAMSGDLDCKTVVVSPPLIPTGDIYASPNPCTIVSPATACSSDISWNVSNTTSGAVYLSVDGGAETLFASGLNGSEEASWIEEPPHYYDFNLYDYAGGVKGTFLDMVRVTAVISIPDPPLASLSVNGQDSIRVNAGDAVNYDWSSTNGDEYSSYLNIFPSSPDPCGNRTGPVAYFNSPSGSISGTIAECQAGYRYTFTYTVTQTPTGGVAQDSVSIDVAGVPSPPPPAESCDYYASPGVPFPCDDNGDSCSGVKYCMPGAPPDEGDGTWSECFDDTCPAVGTLDLTVRLNASQPWQQTLSGTAPLNGVDVRVSANWSGPQENRIYRYQCRYAIDPWQYLTDTENSVVILTDENACNYSNPGSYQMEAQAVAHNDLNGNGWYDGVSELGSVLAEDFSTITVSAVNQPPSVSSVTATQPDYCVSGPAATVNWIYSDPEGQPQSAYQVQVDDVASAWSSPLTFDSGKVPGSVTITGTSTGIPPWAWNTTYKARVRVWDSQDTVSNWTESGSWTTPKHPYPNVDFNWSPLSPSANQQIQFTDLTQFFDGGGSKIWSWLFKAPNPSPSSSLQNPTYTYTDPGPYNVSLTVTDKDGYACSRAKPISIDRPIPVWKEVSPK